MKMEKAEHEAREKLEREKRIAADAAFIEEIKPVARAVIRLVRRAGCKSRATVTLARACGCPKGWNAAKVKRVVAAFNREMFAFADGRELQLVTDYQTLSEFGLIQPRPRRDVPGRGEKVEDPLSEGRARLGRKLAKMRDDSMAGARQALIEMLPSPSGVLRVTVSEVDAMADVFAEASSGPGKKYSSRCTFRKTDLSCSSAILRGWNESVAGRGLATIHGMVTLAALPVETGREGEEAFRAKWVRKSRGFSLVTEDGYIVRRNGETTHGPTLAACRAQLTRRATEARLDAHEREIMARLEAHRFNGDAEVEVTVSDSCRAGNCKTGTLAFRDAHFAGRESVPVRELVMVADTVSERKFCYAAALQAIRRAKRHELKLAAA